MSKIAKGIRTGLKSIGKAIKKVASSKIVKIIVIAALIYVGGAALGAWSSPFTSINGALVGGGAQTTGSQMLAAKGTAAGTATNAAKLGSMVGAPEATLAATNVAGTTAAGTAAGTAANVAATPAAAPTVAAETAGTATNAAKLGSMVGKSEAALAGTQEVAKKGIISRMMSSVGTFAKNEPMATAMLVGAAGSAASPDEMDVLKERDKLDRAAEDENRARREKNMDLAGINLGVAPSFKPLTDSFGNQIYNQNGIINRNRGAG